MPSDRLTVRLDKAQLKKLKKIARSQDLTLSDIVRQALESFLEAGGSKPPISSSFLQYDSLESLIRRIEQLEKQVQYLTRKLEESGSTPKEVIIERTTTRAKVVGEIEGMKDLLDNPWAEILRKKGKD